MMLMIMMIVIVLMMVIIIIIITVVQMATRKFIISFNSSSKNIIFNISIILATNNIAMLFSTFFLIKIWLLLVEIIYIYGG